MRVAERQIDRIENQNRVFDSESISDDTSEEESKSGSNARPGSNSFDDRDTTNDNSGVNTSKGKANNNKSRVSTDAGNKSRDNTMAKSMDSGYESSNFKALQESLDSIADPDAHKAR